jgi:hypothetical protein
VIEAPPVVKDTLPQAARRAVRGLMADVLALLALGALLLVTLVH